MKIPNRQFCEEKINHSKISCEDKGRTFYFLNLLKKNVSRIKIDGCVPIPGLGCDYLIITWTERQHFVELKGTDVRHAVRQLVSTIKELHGRRPEEPVFAWVVSRKVPLIESVIQSFKQQFLKDINAHLKFKRDGSEHELTD